MDTIPNDRYPEWTRFEMDIIPNGHHSEWAHSWIIKIMDTSLGMYSHQSSLIHFSHYIFEVTRANSVLTSFPILKNFAKEMCCTFKN